MIEEELAFLATGAAAAAFAGAVRRASWRIWMAGYLLLVVAIVLALSVERGA